MVDQVNPKIELFKVQEQIKGTPALHNLGAHLGYKNIRDKNFSILSLVDIQGSLLDIGYPPFK